MRSSEDWVKVLFLDFLFSSVIKGDFPYYKELDYIFLSAIQVPTSFSSCSF